MQLKAVVQMFPVHCVRRTVLERISSGGDWSNILILC